MKKITGLKRSKVAFCLCQQVLNVLDKSIFWLWVLSFIAAVRFGQKPGDALHLAREENPDADQRDKRQPGDQQRHEPGHIVGLRTRRDRDALVVEALDQASDRSAHRFGSVRPSVKVPWISGTLDQHVAHAALIDLVEQLRKGNVPRGRVLAGVLDRDGFNRVLAGVLDRDGCTGSASFEPQPSRSPRPWRARHR